MKKDIYTYILKDAQGNKVKEFNYFSKTIKEYLNKGYTFEFLK